MYSSPAASAIHKAIYIFILDMDILVIGNCGTAKWLGVRNYLNSE
jgi:hypothetical protein